MFTYMELKQAGLINNLMIVHPVHDKIIPLEHVCKCLFGVKTLPISTCLVKLEFNNIVVKYTGVYYIKASRFGQFIDNVGCLDKYENKYLIINYCNFLETELIGIQKDIYIFNKKFIEYLEKHKPINYNVIINMIGKNHCNGMIAGYEKSINIMMIKYDHCVVSYGYNVVASEMYVCLNTNLCRDNTQYAHDPIDEYNYTNDTFKKLAEEIFQSLLRKNVDEYVIYNLEKITGNISFAKMLVVAHNNNDCVIPLNHANSIVQFKNEELEQNYNFKFTKSYEEGTIWNKNNDDIMLNFEGLNRYYLNLDDTFIDNNEQVKTLYYDITNELINSYKTLYNYFK